MKKYFGVFIFGLGFYQSQDYKVGKNGEVTFEPISSQSEKYSKTIPFAASKKANIIKIITASLGKTSSENTWTQDKNLKDATYSVKITGSTIRFDYTDNTKDLLTKKKIKDLITKVEAELKK